MIKNLTSIILPIWIVEKKRVTLERYIKWTLNSLCRTTHSPFELIVYVNEYKQSDLDFVDKYTKQFANNKYCKSVKILKHTDNTGWTGAIDSGIEESNGEFVAFVNDDLIFSENWLKDTLKHFRPDIGAVGPTTNFVAGMQNVSFNKPKVNEERVNWIIGFCMIVRKKALDLIKAQKGEMYYIDPIFYPGGAEEIDVCIRLKKVGYEILIARDVFIHHFGSKSLSLFPEFQNGQAFHKKRLDLLFNKHGEQYKQVIETQKCPTIAIGIPTVGNIDHLFFGAYHWILDETTKYFGEDSVIPIIAPRNLIHVGRSEIARQAMMFGAERLIFIDDDQICGKDIIVKLYKHNKDFVTALAYMRQPPHKPTIYRGRTRDDKLLEAYDYREGLVEIEASGFPCTMIKMDVIKTILQKKDKEIKKRGGLFYINRFGEDLNFCKDLKDLGYKLYCDTNLVVDHLGEKMRVNSQTFISYNQQQQSKKMGK